MKKHASKEAYLQRLQELAEVNKPALKESGVRNLGTLIDYKRGADGIAYGIVKENHNYYIKKAGTKQDPNVADFAYIGGLSNIKEFQYPKLAEAEKQRNMIFQTINEAAALRPDKNGSKKKMLNEDVAKDEIDQAASKVGDLDAATSAEATPAPEMGSGESLPSAEEPPAEPAADAGIPPAEDAGAGDEELPPADDLPSVDDAGAGDEELPPADDVEGGATGDEAPDEANKELEKAIGKITNTIRKTDMTDAQVKSYINSFIVAFKDKLPEIEIEDRKEMANKLIKVVNPEDMEDLGNDIPQDKPEGMGPEAGIEEEQQPCAECGGFGKYAESRGYDSPEKFMECDDEEKSNVISGYANAHAEGQNDGDFKTIAIVITPEILDKLKGEYGHEDFANQVEPMANSMNETSEEDKMAQLNELWGGLGSLGKAAVGGIGKGIQKGAQAVAGGAKNLYQAGAEKVGQAKQAIGQAATGIKQAYNAGEINPEVAKLEAAAADLGKRIAALNKRVVGAGQQPVNVKSILATIQNQLGAGGQANLSKLRTAESAIPADSVEVQPNMLKEEEEEETPEGLEGIEGGEESTEEKPEEFGAEEKPEDELDVDALDVSPEGGAEEKPAISFAPAAQTLGGGVMKPDGAPTTIRIEPDKSVEITMNESEKKLRKYIRNRLEENAGLKKPSLNEGKKSEKLKKLDEVIDKQYKLYESVVKKKDKLNEVFGMSLKEKFASLDPSNAPEVTKLFIKAFAEILTNPQMGAIGRAARNTTNDQRYQLLKQYVEGGGGTLRLAPDNTSVIFAPQALKNIATKSEFGSGGTQGKTSFGGSV